MAPYSVLLYRKTMVRYTAHTGFHDKAGFFLTKQVLPCIIVGENIGC